MKKIIFTLPTLPLVGMEQMVNGYTIEYNHMFGGYDVTHPEIGHCGWYTNLEDAIEDCNKG